jgi:hypothetical protein
MQFKPWLSDNIYLPILKKNNKLLEMEKQN